MAIAIGVSSKGRTGGATSIATTGVTTQASGSVIVGGMIFQGTFSSYVDNKSNTPYVQISVERTFDTTFSGKARMYYFANAAGGATHTTTAAITVANAITNLMAEITGADTASPLDTGATSAIDTASPYTASITPTVGNRLLVAFLAGDSGSNPATHAESSGFTILTSAEETNGATFWEGCLAYKIVAADGSTAYTVSFTDSGAAETGVFLAAFKEATAAGVLKRNNLMLMGMNR